MVKEKSDEKKNDKVQMNVLLPADLRTRFKKRCVEEDVNYSVKMEELIEAYLKQ